jgi:hypothetical protein
MLEPENPRLTANITKHKILKTQLLDTGLDIAIVPIKLAMTNRKSKVAVFKA